MSFPDIRAILDAEARKLWHRQIDQTRLGEPVALDDSSLYPLADEIARQLSVDVMRAALVKHEVEHSYKSTREKSSDLGRRIIMGLKKGQRPLPLDLADATYTLKNKHFPMRWLVGAVYRNEILEPEFLLAKESVDELQHARDTYDFVLYPRWGTRTLWDFSNDNDEPELPFDE